VFAILIQIKENKMKKLYITALCFSLFSSPSFSKVAASCYWTGYSACLAGCKLATTFGQKTKSCDAKCSKSSSKWCNQEPYREED